MKLTARGIAVIEGDNYLSAEIINEGRLDVASAHALLDPLRQYIPVGGVVVDVGASLGDTAAVLSEMVGEAGVVHAFEPNPPTLECLRHNMRECANVFTYEAGLGTKDHQPVGVVLDTNNVGASRLEPQPDGRIIVLPLDIFSASWSRLDFLKIDAEGWEPLVLDGARETILRHRPAMLIEVNTWPLGKMGFTPDDIWSRLDALNYQFERFDGPYGDVLALPKERV